MRAIIFMLGIGVLAAFPALAQPPVGDGSKIEILMPGPFVPDTAQVREGDVWWVLFQAAGEQVRLRYAPLVVQPSRSGLGKFAADGFQNDEVILLFRGTKELPRGPVSTLFNGWLGLVPGLEFLLGEHANGGVHIEVQPFTNSLVSGMPINVPGTGDYEIRIRDDLGKTQVIYQSQWRGEGSKENPFVEGIPGLIWAGDLDQDHKVDLLLTLQTHYAAPRYALYLSSHAEGDELVHLVAEYEGPGC